MTPFKFYFWFAIFVESFPIVPISIGLRKWARLSLGLKFFLGYLIADFLLNLVGDYYYYIRVNNLFLYYFYSFFQSSFLLAMFRFFFKNKTEKLLILILSAFNVCLIVFDLIFISHIGYNYVSGFCINITIVIVSVYFFSRNFVKPNKGESHFYEINLTVSLIVILQFFVKSVAVFLEKYLLETQTNAFLWFQSKDIYYFFMLLSLLVYTYAFYNFKVDEK